MNVIDIPRLWKWWCCHSVNQKLKEGFTGQMAADDVEVGFCDEAEFGALDPITKRLPREHTLREV